MFAYIHFPKAAGSTMATILRQSFLSQHCDVRCGNAFRGQPRLTARVLRRIRLVYPRLISIQGHGVLPWSDLDSCGSPPQYYAVFRDPLERCASEYQYRVIRGGLTASFDQWIATPIARNRMTKMLCGREDAAAAIQVSKQRLGCVGLMHKFDEFLILFRAWMNVLQLDIRYRAKNVISNNQIKRKLLSDSATRTQLIEANEHDLVLYSHIITHQYPQQRAAYGGSLAHEVAAFQESNTRPSPYPRQLPSMLKRELVYKPLALRLAAA